MEIKIVRDAITREELCAIAERQFGDFVKAVVDVGKEIMAIGGELHADGEVLLMEQEGSNREHTWGINLYPDKPDKEWIEFDSIVNIKPSYGNRSRVVEDQAVREKIRIIIKKLVH